MANDQVTTVKALYEGLDRTGIQGVILLATSWVFAGFSYYLSKTTGDDWFTRSGSVMALFGAVATFRLANYLYKALAIALKEKLGSEEGAFELLLEPPPLHQRLSYLSYLTGIVGTAIWAYGDLLL